MSTLTNLKLKCADQRGVILLSDRNEVFASADLLKKSFITRAWLDRTLIDCALGKCLLSAEVEQRGNRLEATRVWLNLEMNTLAENQDRSLFKNFGLELNKPKEETEAFLDNTSLEKVADKLGMRLKRTERKDKSIRQGDLIGFSFDNKFLEKLNNRQTERINALSKINDEPHFLDLTFTPDWRMVTGMGEASVYETNLTLHHIYGIPYIPASTIKGVLLRDFDDKTEKEIIETIFGAGDEKKSNQKPKKGQAIFFDAFPTKAPRIELDVMTPHYPEYYSKGKPPADWQNPTPITFLTVGKGTSFRFLIGLPKNIEKSAVAEKLKNVLSQNGLGAKTAVGYGTFTKI